MPVHYQLLPVNILILQRGIISGAHVCNPVTYTPAGWRVTRCCPSVSPLGLLSHPLLTRVTRSHTCRLAGDPLLSSVTHVVVDEVHERTMQVNLGVVCSLGTKLGVCIAAIAYSRLAAAFLLCSNEAQQQ